MNEDYRQRRRAAFIGSALLSIASLGGWYVAGFLDGIGAADLPAFANGSIWWMCFLGPPMLFGYIIARQTGVGRRLPIFWGAFSGIVLPSVLGALYLTLRLGGGAVLVIVSIAAAVVAAAYGGLFVLGASLRRASHLARVPGAEVRR